MRLTWGKVCNGSDEVKVHRGSSLLHWFPPIGWWARRWDEILFLRLRRLQICHVSMSFIRITCLNHSTSSTCQFSYFSLFSYNSDFLAVSLLSFINFFYIQRLDTFFQAGCPFWRQEGHLVHRKILGVRLLVTIWSFGYIIAPVVTTTSVILCPNKIQNGDVLVPANPDPSGKWPLKWRDREIHSLDTIV